jgi:DNA-binding transcriptional LysR family regulator
MDWDNIRIFHNVARQGSVGQAARELGVNATTVLRHLDALEKEYGLTLFLRLQTGYILTPEGHSLAAEAETLARDAEALRRKAAMFQDPGRGPLSVGVPAHTMINYSQVFCEFLNDYPNINLTIQAGRNFNELNETTVDTSLLLTNRPPPDYVGREVLKLTFSLYAHPHYLSAKAAPPWAPEDLEWILWNTSENANAPNPHDEEWSVFQKLVKNNGLDVNAVMTCNSLQLVAHAVSEGLGVGVLPRHVAEPLGLCEIDEFGASFDIGLWLLTHKDTKKQPRKRLFMKFIQSRLQARYPMYVAEHRQSPLT